MTAVDGVGPFEASFSFESQSERLSAQASEVLQLIHELTRPDALQSIENTAQLVTSLGAAAMYLQRGSDQLRPTLVPTATIDVVADQPAIVESAPQLDELAPCQPIPESQDPTDEVITASVPISNTEENLLKLGAAPTREGSSHETELNLDRVAQNNAKAREAYGDGVRTFILEDDDYCQIDGKTIPICLPKSNLTAQVQRKKLLIALLNNGTRRLSAPDFKHIFSGSPSSPVARLAEHLLDENGNSIVVIEHPSAKRAFYSLAPDVVVKDLRIAHSESQDSTVLVDEIASTKSSMTTTDLDGETDTPEDEANQTIEELPAMTRSVKVFPDRLQIGDDVFALYEDEDELLMALKDAPRFMDVEDVAALVFPNLDTADETELEEVGDQLFVLFKRGLLEISYPDTAKPAYKINNNAKSEVDQKYIVVVDNRTVLLDNLDIALLSIYAKSRHPLNPGEAAKKVVDGFLPQNQYDISVRTIKKYLGTMGLLYKEPGSPARTLSNLARSSRELSSLINGQQIDPEQRSGADITASSELAGKPSATEILESTLPKTELFLDCLVIGDEVRAFNQHEKEVLDRLNSNFGVEILEDDLIMDYYGVVNSETREAYGATIGYFVKELIDTGHVSRIRHGGKFTLRLITAVTGNF